jgi:hypothetical protein
MFQFMFMVQLLVKFKFFIQELWERKSLQILHQQLHHKHELEHLCNIYTIENNIF